MRNNEELIDNFFEVELLDEDQFLRLKETLTRIGLMIKKPKYEKSVLNQTCHILHKQGRYYIVHFKQMFLLDGKIDKTVYSEEDKLRTQKIVELLQRWGLIEVIFEPDKIIDDAKVNVTVIPFKDKINWELKTKYNIGERHYVQYD